MTKKKPKVIRRRAVGIQVVAGGKVFPNAHIIYEEMYDDGTYGKIVRGHTLHGVEGAASLNARTKKERDFHRQAVRTDLFPTMQAASILIDEIWRACKTLDEKRGIEEK